LFRNDLSYPGGAQGSEVEIADYLGNQRRL
jgi:hypothetical protein